MYEWGPYFCLSDLSWNIRYWGKGDRYSLENLMKIGYETETVACHVFELRWNGKDNGKTFHSQVSWNLQCNIDRKKEKERKQKNAWPLNELNGKKRSDMIAVACITLYLVLAARPKPGPTNSEEQNEGGTLWISRIHRKPANSRTKPEAIMNRMLW